MYILFLSNANISCREAIILFNDKQKPLAEEVVHRMVVNAVEMEGTVTGEHGVGLIKRDYLPHELGETTVDVMRKVRQTSLSFFLLLLSSSMSFQIATKFAESLMH